ncbi:HAD-IA family hydrolase [Terrilactibacillus sp. BCM23-1]|uniref:HAD-IA family hydrolase n=1 Tax=Terrilactibacillus tamarindi TaxID=2599694 RepID=A0A6N8CL64_9BACI|nr:HAD family hydrolase [Terrilactibacillus tamarindi]MTT30451.1 HAD-IA family hydrolase [Terrilactibacillus tamarindi]
MIKAVVFDFDGVIMDSETVMYKTMREMYQKYGIDLPLEVWWKAVGTHGGFDPIAYLEEQTGKRIDSDSFYKERDELFLSRAQKETPLPGVEALIKTIDSLGLKIGLATSSEAGWAEGHLKRLGLRDYFSCIRTAGDVEKVKPDPALYLQAVKCLGVEPHEALAIEDSYNGSLGAKNAGLYCVVVPNFVTKNMTFDHVDHRLDTLENVQIESIIQLFEDKVSK